MKYAPLYSALFLVGALCHAGGLKISRSTLRGKDANKAVEQALKTYRPITIVYSDPESKSNDVVKTTKAIMSALGPSTVLIFVDSTDLKELPEDAQKQLVGGQAGKGFPKTVIVRPNWYSVVGIIPAEHDTTKLRKMLAIAKDRVKGVSKKIREEEVDRKARMIKAQREAEKLLRHGKFND